MESAKNSLGRSEWLEDGKEEESEQQETAEWRRLAEGLQVQLTIMTNERDRLKRADDHYSHAGSDQRKYITSVVVVTADSEDVQVLVCSRCGAMVLDCALHDEFHGIANG